MVSVNDVNANKLIEEVAKELKKMKEINPPEWAYFSKTGVHKERVPTQKDWWYIRTASLLRRIYLKPMGVSRLRVVYGGRKNRGHKPNKFFKGSGSVIRKSLQQLEKAKLVKKSENKKGREITPEGRKLLDSISYKLYKKNN